LPTKQWTVRLTEAAEADFVDILQWTKWRFGDRQARAYGRTLREAITALSGGPATLGVRPRPEVGSSYFTLHVARDGRRGRHFLLFATAETPGTRLIQVLRILHDAMDLRQHVP
jgi:toxin ParE1/3/4